MKFTAFLFALFAAIVATVAATETNGQRFARGLNPLPPVRRGTGTDSAPQHKPSGTPPASTCSTGNQQCCDTVSTVSDPFVKMVAAAVGAILPVGNAMVGLSCTPIASIVGGGRKCNKQTVCCKNDKFSGLIDLDCDPINIL